jgi:MerR family redox-sensitive transcriptional activator SoxR
MPHMFISDVARQVGIRASTIRYYEQVGILEPPQRTSGQRRYDNTVLYRLALIQHARLTGFSLEEIRRLFFGFAKDTPISARWRKLSQRKLEELDGLIEQIKTMQQLLLKIQKCRCDAVEQCGKAMFKHTAGRPLGNLFEKTVNGSSRPPAI